MKKCLLISYFCSGNIGDLAIANSFYKRLSNFFDVEKYDLNGNTITPNTSTIPNKQSFLIRLLKKVKINIIYKVYKRLSIRKRIKKQLNETKFDLVIFGGGNLLFETSKYSNYLTNIEELCRFIFKRNAKYVFSCIGVGPFYSKKQKLRAYELVKKSVYTSYRDRKSFELLNDNLPLDNNYICVDPVLTEIVPERALTNKDRSYILINFVDLSLFKSNYDKDSVNTKMLEMIKSIITFCKKEIVLFSSDASDYGIIEELQYSLKQQNIFVGVAKPTDVDELIELLSSASFIISSRMHSLIFSYLLKNNFVALSWSEKVRSFMLLVNLEDRVIDYSDLSFDYLKKFINQPIIYDKKVNDGFNHLFDLEEKRWEDLGTVNK